MSMKAMKTGVIQAKSAYNINESGSYCEPLLFVGKNKTLPFIFHFFCRYWNYVATLLPQMLTCEIAHVIITI